MLTVTIVFYALVVTCKKKKNGGTVSQLEFDVLQLILTPLFLRTSLTRPAERLQADHLCANLKPQLVLLLISVPEPGLV